MLLCHFLNCYDGRYVVARVRPIIGYWLAALVKAMRDHRYWGS